MQFVYAKNGRAVNYVAGERWCWTGVSTDCPTDHEYTYAREFRYGEARERYLDRGLNTTDFKNGLPVALSGQTVWSDYDDGEIYADFTASGSTLTTINFYEPGMWRKIGSTASYVHADHLGTLRNTTSATGQAGLLRTFTAFGEPLGGPTDRFGFAGDWGYQRASDSGSLHLGARHYSPGSGRFLQRDPIGIEGGFNVYSYVGNAPTGNVDPTGLMRHVLPPRGQGIPMKTRPGRVLDLGPRAGAAAKKPPLVRLGVVGAAAGAAVVVGVGGYIYVEYDNSNMEKDLTAGRYRRPSRWKFWLWCTGW